MTPIPEQSLSELIARLNRVLRERAMMDLPTLVLPLPQGQVYRDESEVRQQYFSIIILIEQSTTKIDLEPRGDKNFHFVFADQPKGSFRTFSLVPFLPW